MTQVSTLQLRPGQMTLADLRAMSQAFWPGQPQHDNVAGHSMLRYKDAKEWRYIGLLMLATVPAGVIGLTIGDQVEALFEFPVVVAYALAIIQRLSPAATLWKKPL